MRTFTAPAIALVLLAAACSDLPSSLTEAPAPRAATFHAELRCTAYVDQPRLTCDGNVPGGAGPSRNLIIGGQNVYVRLSSNEAAYNPSDSIFEVQVTVQNLMAQAFGTPDGETDTGLRVFFATAPTPVPSGGSVEVHNEDGEAIFISSPEPYFDYPGVLYTGVATPPQAWQFKMDPEVTRFVFSVYVQGQVPHENSVLVFRPEYLPDGGIVNGLWGASASEVFAVGYGGLVRYAGGAWTEDPSPVPDAVLWDVWGSSGSDVFAVGSEGTILHWDGTAWEEMDSGLEDDICGCGITLWGVWGSGPDDVYAVGDEGVILHYDGTEWAARDTMPVSSLYGVWGSGPDNVFAAGEEGGIFHYDGTGWTPMTSGLEGTGEYLNGIWGLSATDVYAPASNGVLHFDGTSWSPLEGAQECEHISIWGSAPDDLFVTNFCGIEHFDGETWAYMDTGGFAIELWGAGPTHVLANTNGGIFRGSP